LLAPPGCKALRWRSRPARAAGPPDGDQGVGPGISPIVTFDPGRDMISRPPTQRALTAAELKLAHERAERMWQAVKSSPCFANPQGLATYLPSWAVIDEQGAFTQNCRAYGPAPRDLRRHNDGALYGVMGGAHQLLYFDTNFIPGDHTLADPATRGNFSRSVAVDGRASTLFAAPRVFGEIGGGTNYQDIIVFTRDGRGTLEPAPLGPLLEAEIARLRKGIADAAHARAPELLEASTMPQAVAERRARREERFCKDRPRADAETMAREIDAEARSDEFGYQRQRQRLAVPPARDPRSVHGGPRLALEAHGQRLAALDTAGRNAAACGRVDPAFAIEHQVRYELAAAGSADCVPMVRLRRDLVVRERPITEVQWMTVWLRDSRCGEALVKDMRIDSRSASANFVPLLREMDGAGARRAIGW
jgi:hypothetical protein